MALNPYATNFLARESVKIRVIVPNMANNPIVEKGVSNIERRSSNAGL